MFDERDFQTYFVGGLIAIQDGDSWVPKVIHELFGVEDFDESVYNVGLRGLKANERSLRINFCPFHEDGYKMFPPAFGYCNNQADGEAFFSTWTGSDRHRKLVTADSLFAKTLSLSPKPGTKERRVEKIKSLFNPVYYSYKEAAEAIWNKQVYSKAISPSVVVRLNKAQPLPVVEYVGVPIGWLHSNGEVEAPAGLNLEEEEFANHEVA